MSNSPKKGNIAIVITLGFVLFIGGYVLGSYFPLSSLLDNPLTGSMFRPGANSHRK